MEKQNNPITLAETQELIKGIETDKAKAILAFIKKFVKITPAKAKEVREEIKKLDIIKLKDEQIVKIIDFMPTDPEDLRKIFAGTETNLDQNETTKILEVVTKYQKK
ncbi:MAG: hypothetical protein ABH817_02660 [archaeon]